MRTQRKFLALLVAIILAISVFPISALADEFPPDASGLCGAESVKWELKENEDGTYTLVISGTGAMADYTAANSGQPWTDKLDSITSIVIENGITAIGDFAFMNAKKAETVTLPEGLTKIGQRAFANCEAMKSPVFPSTLTEIGANPFYSCNAFDEIELPDNLTTMGEMLFYSCKNLSSIKIPASATALPAEFAKDCSNLKSIQIPSNITSIGNGAFSGTGLEKVIIPSTVTTFGTGLFYNCQSLQKVIIEGDAQVGSATFGNCSALKTIIFASASFDIWQETNNYMFGTVLDNCVIVLEGNNVTENSVEKVQKNIPENKSVIILVTNGCDLQNAVFETDELVVPAKEGYTFAGWYVDSAFETEAGSVAAGQTYYAKWYCNSAHEYDLENGTVDGNTTTYHCKNCDGMEVITEKEDNTETCSHETWTEKANTATCTEPGKKSSVCASCGATKEEDVGALGHSFTKYNYNNDATYEKDGTKTAACDRGCGETDTVTAEGTRLVYTPSSSSSSSSTPTYAVTVDSGRHGTVTVSPKSARKGASVTITVKSDDGYELDDLTVTDASGKAVKVTEGKNGKFTFTMPASKVEVEASFTAIKEETLAQRFNDVPNGYWAESEINWAAENGCINGNTAATFNPEGTVTRQQLWMILARLSGYQPADFTEARAWAVDNSISDGANPGGAVSRQQLVAILYRYAVRMGYDASGAADLTAYPDHASVAAYAADAMAWSVANGIVGGTAQGTLAPTGTATRAQFAVILMRFADKTAK